MPGGTGVAGGIRAERNVKPGGKRKIEPPILTLYHRLNFIRRIAVSESIPHRRPGETTITGPGKTAVAAREQIRTRFKQRVNDIHVVGWSTHLDPLCFLSM